MSYKHMLLIQHGGTMCLGPSIGTPKTLTVYELANSYICHHARWDPSLSPLPILCPLLLHLPAFSHQ